MKRTITSKALAMAGFIAATILFASCTWDNDIAYTLEGTWEGNMYQEYYWEGTTYEPSYTEVCFLRDPYTYSSGDGYWIDYFDSWVPWKNTYYANHIVWTVYDGYINILLVEDDIEFQITDYRLSNNVFRGELIGSDGSFGRFSLRHVSSPNWNNYYWGDNYYYTKSGEETIEAGTETAHPIRITN